MSLDFHANRFRAAVPAAESTRHPWHRSWRTRAALLSLVLVAGAWAASHPTALSDWASHPREEDADHVAEAPLEVLVRLVEEASAADRQDEVVRLCKAIIDGYPDHPVVEPARVRLLQASMEVGDVVGAERALQEFRRHHPDSALLPEVLLHVATWQYERGTYADAAQTWTDLIAAVTRNGVASVEDDNAQRMVIVRSLSLWRKIKQEERGRTALERLARFNQALCWERSGDHEAALRAYDRFVARFPQDEHAPEARFRIASLLLERGHPEEALDFFRAVYEDVGAEPAFRCESVYRAGRLLESQRHPDAAAATYARALELGPPDNAMRLAALAQLAHLVEQREPMRALAIYRELASSSSDLAIRAVALQRLAVLESDSASISTHQ